MRRGGADVLRYACSAVDLLMSPTPISRAPCASA